jgi:hypothetical protein
MMAMSVEDAVQQANSAGPDGVAAALEQLADLCRDRKRLGDALHK